MKEKIGPRIYPHSDTAVVACRVKATARQLLEQYAEGERTTLADVLTAALELHVPGFAEANT